METVGISIGAALGVAAFFGGTALLMWIDKRTKQHERDLKHAERIKALEMGQPLPDLAIARAHADQARTIIVGLIGFLVPPALAAIAVGATALVLSQASPGIHLPVLCVIWGVVGLVSLVAVTSSLQAVGGSRAEESAEDKGKDAAKNLSEHIQEPMLNH